MTIDEAIEDYEFKAEFYGDTADEDLAYKYGKIAEWLRELRRARVEIDLLKTLRDGFKADAQKYKAENEKLREKYYEYESKMDGLVCKLTGGLLSKSATLPNDALYSVVEEQMTDELVDENFKLESENARLRESVRNLLTCVKHEECEESCPNYSPAYNTYGYESHGSTVVEDEYLGCCLAGLENCNSMFFNTDEYLRELGIEADDE